MPARTTGRDQSCGSAGKERREGNPTEAVSGRLDRLESRSAGLYNLSNCSSLCFPLLSATQCGQTLEILISRSFIRSARSFIRLFSPFFDLQRIRVSRIVEIKESMPF